VIGGGKIFYITEERSQIPPINSREYIVTAIGYGQCSKSQQPKKASANSSNINCGFTWRGGRVRVHPQQRVQCSVLSHFLGPLFPNQRHKISWQCIIRLMLP